MVVVVVVVVVLDVVVKLVEVEVVLNTKVIVVVVLLARSKYAMECLSVELLSFVTFQRSMYQTVVVMFASEVVVVVVVADGHHLDPYMFQGWRKPPLTSSSGVKVPPYSLGCKYSSVLRV